MNPGTGRAMIIGLPISMARDPGRRGPWRACLDFGGGQSTVFTGEGPREADAREALTGQVRDALDRLRYPPVVVIGGSTDYASCIHLILAGASGWVVHVIRDGRTVASWHSDDGHGELLHQVLHHVSGAPAGIHL